MVIPPFFESSLLHWTVTNKVKLLVHRNLLVTGQACHVTFNFSLYWSYRHDLLKESKLLEEA